jgi:hypothetical protein
MNRPEAVSVSSPPGVESGASAVSVARTVEVLPVFVNINLGSNRVQKRQNIQAEVPAQQLMLTRESLEDGSVRSKSRSIVLLFALIVVVEPDHTEPRVAGRYLDRQLFRQGGDLLPMQLESCDHIRHLIANLQPSIGTFDPPKVSPWNGRFLSLGSLDVEVVGFNSQVGSDVGSGHYVAAHSKVGILPDSHPTTVPSRIAPLGDPSHGG